MMKIYDMYKRSNHVNDNHVTFIRFFVAILVSCCYFSQTVLFYNKPICTQTWDQISGSIVDH